MLQEFPVFNSSSETLSIFNFLNYSGVLFVDVCSLNRRSGIRLPPDPPNGSELRAWWIRGPDHVDSRLRASAKFLFPNHCSPSRHPPPPPWIGGPEHVDSRQRASAKFLFPTLSCGKVLGPRILF